MAFIPGNNRDNHLVGTPRNDTILGRGGDDELFGRNGNDVLDGGNGRDRVFGGDGNDILSGGNGRDYLDGGNGRDRSFGGNGDDVIVVDRHDRKADGGRGTDTVKLDDGGRGHRDHRGDDRHDDHRGDHDGHHDNDVFDLRGVVTNVETIEQGRGDATVILDTQFFLTADGDVKIDLDGGRNDTVKIFYNPRELDIDRQRDGDIVFGPDDHHGRHDDHGDHRDDHGDHGGHNLNELTLVGVEHLEINGQNYDHWLNGHGWG